MEKIIVVLLSILLCCGCMKEPVVRVKIENPIAVERVGETVSLAWEALRSALKDVVPEEIIVVDRDGHEIPSQVVYGG